jgi:hypothetical protein
MLEQLKVDLHVMQVGEWINGLRDREIESDRERDRETERDGKTLPYIHSLEIYTLTAYPLLPPPPLLPVRKGCRHGGHNGSPRLASERRRGAKL